MTTSGQQAAETWSDPEFARSWIDRDNQGDLLDMPRRVSAALVAQDRPGTRLVVDVASGPGGFLEVYLDEFPEARGVWSDASPTMMDEAKQRLARFGDRVEFVIADMTDNGWLPAGADVVTTSRASHHLDRNSLHAYYREAAGALAPGGWLVNLDHIGPTDAWDARLRGVRQRFVPKRSTKSSHHHDYPLCSLDDHLSGFVAAGIPDVEVAWRAFITVLLTGRKPD
ncbi:MAG TPA: class I SAM-dependent methyltransferase [Pseudonocardiaceae bacterium]|nr:class I SAM-dependent methyltransferase [Pseudonocardiaceae bacterium]